MPKRKGKRKPSLSPRNDHDTQALYAKMRQQFTAADLQKYTEIEEGVPAEQVLAEMEQMCRKFQAKKA